MINNTTSTCKILVKSCLLCMLLSLYAHGLDSKQLFSTLNKMLQSTPESKEVSMKMISTEASGLKDFSFVILEREGYWVPLLAHENGKTIIIATPDLILSTDSIVEKNLAKAIKKSQEHNKQLVDDSVLKIFSTHSSSTITLPNKSAKYTTYMVLDPNCPYCKNEVEKLQEYAKDSSLVIMVVGILRQDSLDKAAAFAKLIKNTKSKEEQIAVLKCVFDKGFAPSSVRYDDAKKERDEIYADLALIGMKLQQAGLQGVPYIIKRPN